VAALMAASTALGSETKLEFVFILWLCYLMFCFIYMFYFMSNDSVLFVCMFLFVLFYVFGLFVWLSLLIVRWFMLLCV